MPYEWTDDVAAPDRSGVAGPPGGATERLTGHLPERPIERPVAVLRLWPHRSLTAEGFVGFFAATATLAAVPLLTVLGSVVLWFILLPMLAAVGATWWALRLTYRSGEVLEEMRLWPDRVELVRRERRGERSWEANPHWVRTALHKDGGPVPHYLTLSGSGRTVEIGAFLSEDERIALRPEIEDALRAAQARA